jgi:DNA-binding SARP family transcriptional activator
MCTKLQVRLFGRVRIQSDDDTQLVIESKKALGLFCYLLLYRQRPHTRDMLAEMNWGENSSAHPKKYLRQAIWQIQSNLDASPESQCQALLIAEPDWVQLNPTAPLWLDVAEFEKACAETHKKSVSELSYEDFLCMRQAVDLYQGDLLEGWYEDWCLYERERLQNMCLSLLDKLMEYCEYHNQYEDALAYGNRILRLDVAHERTHRRMVRILYKSGERTAALRQYERCVVALNDELGVEPARETVELYELICNDQEPVNLPEIEPFSANMSSAMVLQRLSYLKKMLYTFQKQVLAEISDLEVALYRSELGNSSPTNDPASNQNMTFQKTLARRHKVPNPAILEKD